MASAHPTSQTDVPELNHDNLSRLERLYPDNLIWRWVGEPELVRENGDKLYTACIRPKEGGDYDDGGPETSALEDQEGLLQFGECCAFKYTSQESQPLGVITRLCDRADSQGQLCSKIVTYKPLVKVASLPDTGANYTKSSLMEAIGIMNLEENEALLLCTKEKENFLQDVIFPVAVRNINLFREFLEPMSRNLYVRGIKVAEHQGKPNYCCLGIYDEAKNQVKLMLDGDFSIKDHLGPELTNEHSKVAHA